MSIFKNPHQTVRLDTIVRRSRPRTTIDAGKQPIFCMSADLPKVGDWRSMRLAGIPLVVVLQADGTLRALVNMCRQRASSLVETSGSGGGLRAFSCPYHAWTYETDGRLRAFSCPYHAWTFETDGRLRSRPAAEHAFDDITVNCDLQLLLDVTGTEDFKALEDIQRNLASGALDRMISGKIEAPLVHFHQEINKAIA